VVVRRLTVALAVQADKICAEHNATIHEKTMDAVNQGGLHGDEYRDWFKDILSAEEAIVEGLDDLGRPENDASVERYVDRLHRNLDGLHDALEQDRIQTDAFFSAAGNSQREAHDLAAEAGLQECSPTDV
jgi:hypothetical protein